MSRNEKANPSSTSDPSFTSFPFYSNDVHITISDGQTVILTFSYQPQLEDPAKHEIARICLTKTHFDKVIEFYTEMDPSQSVN